MERHITGKASDTNKTKSGNGNVIQLEEKMEISSLIKKTLMKYLSAVGWCFELHALLHTKGKTEKCADLHLFFSFSKRGHVRKHLRTNAFIQGKQWHRTWDTKWDEEMTINPQETQKKHWRHTHMNSQSLMGNNNILFRHSLYVYY